MKLIPPIPDWDAVHPLVVHFPVALLSVVPVLLILGLAIPRMRACWHWSAFAVMLMGVVGAFFAVETGEAGAQIADGSEGFREVLETHQELAELTRNVFIGLTVAFALLLIIPLAIRRPLKGALSIGLHAAFLVIYAGCLLILVNAGHNGARLVHEFGVRAMIAVPKAPDSPAP